MTTEKNKLNSSLNSLIFNEEHPYEKGFSNFFEKEIKNALTPLESLRLEKLKIIKKNKPYYYISNVILFVLWIPLVGVFLDANIEIELPFFIGIGAFWACHKYFIGRHKKAYTTNVKEKILPTIASFFGKFTYQENGKIPLSEIKPSNLIPNHNTYESEDMFEGTYKEVKINFAETYFKVRQKNNNRTVFKGVFVLLEMNKNFKGKTIVKTDYGSFGNFFRFKNGLDRVKLEDPQFEKKFEVYSSDQIEARYLLTTAFMDRLLKVNEAFNSKNIQCAFFNNKLLITIPTTNNLFEPKGVNHSIINTEDFKKFLGQMNSIFQIIDILKLNLRIGL